MQSQTKMIFKYLILKLILFKTRRILAMMRAGTVR